MEAIGERNNTGFVLGAVDFCSWGGDNEQGVVMSRGWRVWSELKSACRRMNPQKALLDRTVRHLQSVVGLPRREGERAVETISIQYHECAYKKTAVSLDIRPQIFPDHHFRTLDTGTQSDVEPSSC